MNCDEIRPLLAALVDGELEEPAATAAQEHVAACPSCRGELAACEAIQTAAALAPVDTADVWPAVVAGLGAELDLNAVARELRLLRDEIAALRVEVAGLRRSDPGGTALDLPHFPRPSASPFQIV